MTDKRTWYVEVTYARQGRLGVSRGAVEAKTLDEAKTLARDKIKADDTRIIAVGTY